MYSELSISVNSLSSAEFNGVNILQMAQWTLSIYINVYVHSTKIAEKC